MNPTNTKLAQFAAAFARSRNALVFGLSLVVIVAALPFARASSVRVAAGRAVGVSAVSQVATGVPYGGNATAIAIDPFNAKTVLAATDSGGLFRSNDTGTHWTHVNTGPLPPHLTDVRFSPRRSGLVVLSARLDTRVASRDGIWISTSHGLKWSQVTVRPPCSKGTAAWGIAFAPTSPEIYVGTDCGLAIRDETGSWRVSSVGGKAVYSVIAPAEGTVDVCAEDGHHRSTDDGRTWSSAHGAVAGCDNGVTGSDGGRAPVHTLAASPLSPNVLFAGSTNTAGKVSAFESDDGGNTWKDLNVPPAGTLSTAPFVRTVATSGTGFSVFATNSVRIMVSACVAPAAGRTGCAGTTKSWGDIGPTVPDYNDISAPEKLHDDLQDLAFQGACLRFAATDGGVYQRPCPGLFGGWYSSGFENMGFDALQLYQVTGQLHPDHTDLYIATQDNGIWALYPGATNPLKGIGPEGHRLQLNPSSSSSFADEKEKIVGTLCAPCSDFQSNQHFASGSSAFAGPTAGSFPPLLIAPNTLVAWGPRVGDGYNLYAATDFDVDDPVTWKKKLHLSAPDDAPGVYPAAGGPNASPVLYQTWTRPDKTQGLVRIDGILGANPTVTPASPPDQLHNVETGTCQGSWQCDIPIAVEPTSGKIVVLSDAGTGPSRPPTPRISSNGGRTWTALSALRDLVTDYGQLRYPHQIRTIAFDPTHPNRILVGTEQAGIIESYDRGHTWVTLDQTREINSISNFYFDSRHNDVYVASYGRGLWKLHAPLAVNYSLGGTLPKFTVSVWAVEDDTHTRIELTPDRNGLYRGTVLLNTTIGGALHYHYESERRGLPTLTLGPHEHSTTKDESARGIVYLKDRTN